MNIVLTKFFEEFIQRMVASGKYHTASEVVCAGLRLLMEQDEARPKRIGEIRAKIRAGLDQLDRGQGSSGTEVFLRLDARLNRIERDRRSERA